MATEAQISPDQNRYAPRRWITRFEATLLAAAPGVGILLALLDQFGRFSFLGVPSSFIELSPSKVVVAAIGFLVVAGAYVTLWAEELRGRRLVTRTDIIGSHLFVNTILACSLALTPTGGVLQLLPSIAVIAVGLTVVTYWGHTLVRRIKQASNGHGTIPGPTNIATFAIFAVLSIVAVVAGSSFNSERKLTRRLVVQGTDAILVGTYEGQYILKPFDRVSLSLIPGAVSLQTPDGKLNLQEVDLDLRSACAQ